MGLVQWDSLCLSADQRNVVFCSFSQIKKACCERFVLMLSTSVVWFSLSNEWNTQI
jgi:hypothetical protein